MCIAYACCMKISQNAGETSNFCNLSATRAFLQRCQRMPNVCLTYTQRVDSVPWACCGRAQRMLNVCPTTSARVHDVCCASSPYGRQARGTTLQPHYSIKHSVGATYAARPLSVLSASSQCINVPITLLQRMVNVCIAFWVRRANAKLFEHAQNLSVRQRSPAFS